MGGHHEMDYILEHGVGNLNLPNQDSGRRFLEYCKKRVAEYLKELSEINNEEELYEK